jgi:hypothetical protein
MINILPKSKALNVKLISLNFICSSKNIYLFDILIIALNKNNYLSLLFGNLAAKGKRPFLVKNSKSNNCQTNLKEGR